MALCLPDCKFSSHSTVPHCYGPNPRVRLPCRGPPQRAGLRNGLGKGGLVARDPACPCSHNPLSPCCLRVPGLTPETPFGLPVSLAGGSQAHILSHHPPPPPSPGPHAPASWRVTAAWMSAWAELEGPPGAASAKSLGQQARLGGWEDVCASGSTWGREQALGEVPPRGAVAVPAVCGTPLLPQWPHCSQQPGSLEEVPRPPLPP